MVTRITLVVSVSDLSLDKLIVLYNCYYKMHTYSHNLFPPLSMEILPRRLLIVDREEDTLLTPFEA